MTTLDTRTCFLASAIACVLNALTLGGAGAQVVVESGFDLSFGVATSAATPGTATLTQSFSTNTASNSVLLLLVGSEPDQTETADPTATFGSQNFTPVVSSGSGSGFPRRAFIFALNLGNETAETANISINLTVASSGQGFGASVMQVSNADFSSIQTSVGSVTTTSPFGNTFSNLPTGSLVFGVATQNNNVSGLATAGDFTPTGSATQIGFGAGMIAAYQSGVSGDFDAFYSATVTTQKPYANLAISAIPEPSTVVSLVGGLGVLALLRRRKAA